ncbi:MAG: hypothetical protein BAJALOKI1v1_2610001 [Promethearchaeota archaeon]|nr:MAG: hypothetical protein BAJALOKI1v1_2610001 [Candidatus Lokiarchaeota archaeon]
MNGEELYRYIFNTANDTIFIHDFEGNLLEVNDAACLQLGYRREELLQMNLKDIDSPKFATLINQRLKELEKMGRAVFETEHVKKNGEVIPIEINVRVFSFQGKKAVISVGRDIAAKKRAEKSLKESKQQLKNILNGLTEIVSMIDRDFTVVWGNGSAKRLFGEDIVGSKCYQVFHCTDHPCHPCIVQKTFQDESVHNAESKVITKEGEELIFWCTSSVSSRDAVGKPTKVIEVSRNITERKQIEEKLKVSEKKYRDMAELLPDLIFEIDVDLTLLYTNPAGFRMFGYTPQDLEKGINVMDLIPLEEDKLKIKQRMRQYLKEKQFTPVEYLMERKDGSRFYGRIHTRPMI